VSNFFIREAGCVFIHIPKTGGYSIREGFFKGRYEGPAFGHIPEHWSGLRFAFVRNPYDRLISAWKMFTFGTSKGGQECREMPLRDFLNVVMDDGVLYDERRHTWEEKVRHHTIPQTHPFNCLHLADFIGRFESLNEDFGNVCKAIGVEFHGLPHLNNSEHEHYSHYLDDEIIRLASAYYEKDFELGYV
jgi:hypothetical protein